MRVVLSVLCVLAWWLMPYWSIFTAICENIYQIFQQAKYLVPIFICLLFVCQKQTLKEINEYVPLNKMVRSVYGESEFSRA